MKKTKTGYVGYGPIRRRWDAWYHRPGSTRPRRLPLAIRQLLRALGDLLSLFQRQRRGW